MFLPTSLACEGRTTRTRSSRILPLSVFATPPPSDDDPISPRNNGLVTTCRALQSMLTAQPTSPVTPRLGRALAPPSLSSPIALSFPPTRIQKSSPRGGRKRRRSVDDEDDSDKELQQNFNLRYSTPKRHCAAPISLPLGLERSDFEALETPSDEEEFLSMDEEETWSLEEDRALVDMVLDKLKLTKSEWQDCARSLGKKSGSIGKRWQSLMGEGSVGLRKKKARARPTVDPKMWT
ncbi:MAG: hypothetical protein M1838_001729 [Thelocarpon superellum]|nr:MAG: hypothetical protein M1838_001729 [Thelocarpon superellum]